MKKKYIAILLGITLGMTALAGCSGTSTSESSTTQESQSVTGATERSEKMTGETEEADVYGEVRAVSDEGITIKVGTMKQMEKPDDAGKAPNAQPPANMEKPDGDGQGMPSMLDLTDEEKEIKITDDTVIVRGSMGGMGGGPGSSQGVDSYDAVNAYTSDTEVDGETIASTGTDENAVNVSEGASVILKDAAITRDSSESTGGDNSSFYGVGAAVLATDGNAYVKGGQFTTDAAGGAGLFAYNNGTVYAADTKITTKQDTSGGIHAAGGGTFYAWDLDVETNGESSAAIRSDRGGGKMVVDGGTYTSNGTGSPAIYSTADIAVNEATLAANGSEAICIEGLNSIHLYDSDLTGNMSDDSRNDCTWNVILYQSMSGDSEVGNSTFEMDGGSLTAKNGGMFYTTNTESTITLDDVDITNAEDSEFFLKCTGNSNQRGWGSTGANGADCLFTAVDQTMEGNVIWDSISDLDFYMADESTLTGAVTQDDSNAGDGGDGYCNLYIGEDATWIVTGDSTVSALHCAGTIEDNEGKTVTVKGTDGTVYVKGDSSYTITVSTYEDSADLSGASATTSWSAYETEKPTELK